MKEKRFYILQANSLNKEDIIVEGTNRYTQIARVRKEKIYDGQKILKVWTLAGAYRMRLTYFQDRQFYIKIQRELELLDEIPTEQKKSKFYISSIDIDASKKFFKYVNKLPKNKKKLIIKSPIE